MTTLENRFQQRNQELGAFLYAVRERQQRSVSDCAKLLATSRRRYNAIERGEVAITVVELELLMQYLGLPYRTPLDTTASEKEAQRVVVRAQPGDLVQLLITGPEGS